MRSRALESTVIGQITARNVPDTKSVVAQLGGIRYSVPFDVTFILLYAMYLTLVLLVLCRTLYIFSSLNLRYVNLWLNFLAKCVNFAWTTVFGYQMRFIKSQEIGLFLLNLMICLLANFLAKCVGCLCHWIPRSKLLLSIVLTKSTTVRDKINPNLRNSLIVKRISVLALRVFWFSNTHFVMSFSFVTLRLHFMNPYSFYSSARRDYFILMANGDVSLDGVAFSRLDWL